jgi:hypothetical protein
LFGEDDEAGEEGELDKAKAEGENGQLAQIARSPADNQPKKLRT